MSFELFFLKQGFLSLQKKNIKQGFLENIRLANME
jgi:hypothetical protein